jgi:hypothetical protein
MKARCNPKYTRRRDHKNYAARGIKICESWVGDFPQFLRDVGLRPSAKHSLDRIDNDGDYEPGNVRWSTNIEQCANTRKNRILIFMGKKLALKAAMRAAGCLLNESSVRGRLSRGWDADRALTAPRGKRGRLTPA